MFLKQLTNKINYNTKIENKILSQDIKVIFQKYYGKDATENEELKIEN